MPICHYADGESDGETIQCPTKDESIRTQRRMIRDMQHRPDLTITDSWTGRIFNIRDYFDMHAMTMLVISEVDARSSDLLSHINDIIPNSNTVSGLELGTYWRQP